MLAAAWPAAAAPSWLLDVEIGWLHDSNLPRAQREIDIRSGSALTGALAAGRFFALDDRNGLTLTADARAARYDGFSGLDFEALGGTISAKHKFGLGPLVPWVSASFSAAREDYREPSRDGDRYSLTLTAGKRLTERFDGSLAFILDRRDTHGPVPVFEVEGRTGLVRVGYSLLERLDVTASFSVRGGDVTSSTRRNQQIFRASDAVAPDPAFGPDYFSYRLYGVTRTPSLGLHWAIAEYSSLQVVYARELTHAVMGLNYYSTLLNATFIHRF